MLTKLILLLLRLIMCMLICEKNVFAKFLISCISLWKNDAVCKPVPIFWVLKFYIASKSYWTNWAHGKKKKRKRIHIRVLQLQPSLPVQEAFEPPAGGSLGIAWKSMFVLSFTVFPKYPMSSLRDRIQD